VLYYLCMSHNVKKLKREFLEYMEIEKGRSLYTVRNYEQYLNKFLDFAKVERPQDITEEIVREYRLWLNRQKASRHISAERETLKKKTQNYHLIALRAFLRYLGKRGMKSLPPEKIELAKIPERELDLISSEELERLLETPKESDLRSLRDKAILELLFSTGLRVSELAALQRDLDLPR
jgi:integrase/recombinase XerD